MIPMKNSTIFKSRWMALIWAAGIIWFALDISTPDGPPAEDGKAQVTDATGAPVKDEDVKKLEGIIKGL
jgi:hypothetical protein